MVNAKTDTRTEGDGIKLIIPFSPFIMYTPFPEHFKPPTFQTYDGLSDPLDHLAMFHARMLFYADILSDPILCRTFPSTLTNSALRWFFNLPPFSINSFYDLSCKFLQHHKTSSTTQHYKRTRDQNHHDEEEVEESEPVHKTSRTTSKSCSCRGKRNDTDNIIFIHDDDLTKIHTQKNDPIMVITVKTMNSTVLRVLIDQGSSADILYYDAFVRLGLKDPILRPFAGALSGEEKGQIKGCIDLETTFGEGEHAKTISVGYVVVDAVTAYNIIIGRPSLNKLGARVSTQHLTMNYPLPNGKVGVVRADQKKTVT